VENPKGGDFARDYDDVVNGPGGLAAHFVWCNRGKESVTLNLKSPAAWTPAPLLDDADALVSNLARDRPRAWPFARRPRRAPPEVIPVEIDGYGPGGPISHKRATTC
jgi:crotonobetainyl-CoA:carnitine CoA-transferase CaiB-like acyl-CoA transferase